jgi:hypothetical protein
MKAKAGFRVSIDAEALERIWQWTHLASGEFSCLAMVSDDLVVHGVQLFEQVCTAASTEIDQQALAKFLVQHRQPEKVRCWIHSHGNLNVFWSQQDEACIEGLANESMLVSIVVNKRHELLCRVDTWNPVRVTLDDLAVEVRLPDYNIKKECELTFREFVTEVQPVLRAPQWEPGKPWQPKKDQPLQRVMQGWPDWDDDDLATWRGP